MEKKLISNLGSFSTRVRTCGPPSSVAKSHTTFTTPPESDEVAATSSASVAGLQFGGGDLVATYLDDPGLGSPWRAPTSAETSMLLFPVPDSSADLEPQV